MSKTIGLVTFSDDMTILLKAQRTLSGEYRIPDGVNVIAPKAFKDCKKLTAISCPDSLIEIGEKAFYRCLRLMTINLPVNLALIGEHCFKSCHQLVSVEIPDSVDEIPNSLFENCTGLKTVRLPDSLTSIPNAAFFNCRKLESIELPKNIQSIDYCAFADCENLRSLELPEGLQTIGSCAFSGSGLEKIHIPVTVDDIRTIFCGMPNLKTFTVSDDNRFYLAKDGSLYTDEGRTLVRCVILDSDEYRVADGVTTISKLALARFPNLKRVVMSNTVNFIEKLAFEGDNALEQIKYSESLIGIGAVQFFDEPLLTEIEIPAFVSSINTWAFLHIPHLRVFKVSPLNAHFDARDGVLYSNCGRTLFRVPPTKKGVFTVPKGVSRISENAFYRCTDISLVRIPETVCEIEEDAFFVSNSPQSRSFQRQYVPTEYYSS